MAWTPYGMRGKTEKKENRRIEGRRENN